MTRRAFFIRVGSVAVVFLEDPVDGGRLCDEEQGDEEDDEGDDGRLPDVESVWAARVLGEGEDEARGGRGERGEMGDEEVKPDEADEEDGPIVFRHG